MRDKRFGVFTDACQPSSSWLMMGDACDGRVPQPLLKSDSYYILRETRKNIFYEDLIGLCIDGEDVKLSRSVAVHHCDLCFFAPGDLAGATELTRLLYVNIRPDLFGLNYIMKLNQSQKSPECLEEARVAPAHHSAR